MIEKISGYCKNTWNFVYEQGYSVYELILKVLMKQDEIIDEVNDLETYVGGFDQRITDNTNNVSINSGKIVSLEIKHDADIETLETAIDNNYDQIQYLNDQFTDGQTGLMIDGGFFGNDEIDKNYDGGVW